MRQFLRLHYCTREFIKRNIIASIRFVVSFVQEYEYVSFMHYGLIALMIEAEIISETSANFYATARHNIPEDSYLE
jgi:uncharacterized protein with HEPN domain